MLHPASLADVSLHVLRFPNRVPAPLLGLTLATLPITLFCSPARKGLSGQ